MSIASITIAANKVLNDLGYEDETMSYYVLRFGPFGIFGGIEIWNEHCFKNE